MLFFEIEFETHNKLNLLLHHLQFAKPEITIDDVKNSLQNWNILPSEDDEFLSQMGKYLHSTLGKIEEKMFKQLPAIAQQISGIFVFFCVLHN